MWPVLALGAILLTGMLPVQSAGGAELDGPGQSAAFLMQQSVTVRRNGLHNQLLRSLRHLRDPELTPLFTELSRSEHPALRVHGILGLAEVRSERRLDLTLLAQVEEPGVQAELITAAMDSDLLANDDAKKLLDWPGLDLGVRLLVAVQLLGDGQLDSPAVPRAGLDSPRLARRSLAGLALHQMGDKAGTEVLQQVNASDDSQRDAVRQMLLETALQHDFHHAASWAYAITTEPGIDARLELLALRVAMRFGDPRAVQAWQQRFESTTDPAQRNRLTLVALGLSPWLEPGVFDVLINDAEALIQQAGHAGKAVASNSRDLADQVVALIQMNYALANSWALSYAKTEAEVINSQLILLGLVLAADQGPDLGRARRLDDAVSAGQVLFEQDPASATNLLRPILASPDTDPMLTQAILLGLISTLKGDPSQVVADLPTFNKPGNNHLALLLLARHGQPLSERQMQDLALLVQGGGELQPSLRIQAGWCWLKRTQQTDAALARVLRSL